MIRGVVVSLNIRHLTTTNICYVITLHLWYNPHKWQGVTMKNYCLELFSEASTWRGLIVFASALGATLNPDMQSLIITTGLGVSGALGVILKDKP